MILPKEYKHTEKNFWNACGFGAKEMDDVFKSIVESKNSIPASKGIAFIEEMNITTRAKMALSFCLAGYLANIKFDGDMASYNVMMSKEIIELKKQIVPLKKNKK